MLEQTGILAIGLCIYLFKMSKSDKNIHIKLPYFDTEPKSVLCASTLIVYDPHQCMKFEENRYKHFWEITSDEWMARLTHRLRSF